MQKKNPTLHLLLLDPSQNDAEQVVSLLRNAGHATRAHRVTSPDDLEECLGNQSWDLFIAREADNELTYEQCLSELKRLDKDIPFILVADAPVEETILAALRAGARDVLPREALSRLVLVAKREFAGLEDRRRRNKLESYLHEAEKRCQLLLESSRDAIAYVGDGMHIFANHSYLELFKYEDIDDLMCMPLMDMVAGKDQDALKEVLKSLKDSEGEATLSCTVRKSDDTEIEVTLSFSGATYDGEACIQLIARPQVDSELEEKLKRFSSEDLLTGLFNKVYFGEQLEIAREKALSGTQKGAVFYIELDDFAEARAQYSINGSDTLLAEAATLLKSVCAATDIVSRLADNTFAVLSPGIEEKATTDLAEKIRAAVEEHLFTLGQKSVQRTVSIGIVRINENAPAVKELLERCHKACAHVRTLPDHKKGNGWYLFNALDFEAGGRNEDLAAMLQQAMDDNRFKLLFQPVISLRGEGDEYYESFLRMVNNEGREISPNEFLPVDNWPNWRSSWIAGWCCRTSRVSRHIGRRVMSPACSST